MSPEKIKEILEKHFWLQTLETNNSYVRTHDDHDGTWEGKIAVWIDKMGDIWVGTDQCKQNLRFRTYGGGGMSLRTRNALLILAEAIRLDELEKPEPKILHNKNTL